LAAVAVAIPVEVLPDSVVVVRLLLDPRGSSAETLRDSLAPEAAAGMLVVPGTAYYSSSMTALLTASGAEVVPATPPTVAVTSKGTGWTWVLHPTKPGHQQLWITLSALGVTRTGAPVRGYYLAPFYTIRRDWWRIVREWGE